MGILMVLSGFVNEPVVALTRPIRRCFSTFFDSVDVSIPLPDQPLVILGLVYLIYDRRIVYGDRHDIRLMRPEHGPRAFPRGFRTFQQIAEQPGVPNHRMPPAIREC